MYRAGEIVLLPFPFSDIDSSKRRPAGRMTIEHAKESGGLQELVYREIGKQSD